MNDAWLSRVGEMRRLNGHEFARLMNGGVGAVVEAYAPFASLSLSEARAFEKVCEATFRRKDQGEARADSGC